MIVSSICTLVQPLSTLSFGNKYGVRELFMNNKLPQVKQDIYGLKLTKKNCSREHIIPRSHGGSSQNHNIALADKYTNSIRGTQPLSTFTTLENVVNYLLQFVGIRIKDGRSKVRFDGNKYIRSLIPSLKHEGINLDMKI